MLGSVHHPWPESVVHAQPLPSHHQINHTTYLPANQPNQVRQAAEAALERAQLERGPATASSSLAAGGADGEGGVDASGGVGGAKAANPKKKGKKKGRK